VFTVAHHCPPLSPVLTEMNPVHTLFHPSSLFPSGFPINILYTFLSSSVRATCPRLSHSLSLDRSNNVWRSKLWSSSLCNYLHFFVNLSLLGLCMRHSHQKL